MERKKNFDVSGSGVGSTIASGSAVGGGNDEADDGFKFASDDDDDDDEDCLGINAGDELRSPQSAKEDGNESGRKGSYNGATAAS